MNSAFCVWFYGLSGAGKTTMSNALAEALRGRGITTVQLDGDEFRRGISSDLGFDQQSRSENIRRAAQMAKLLLDQDICVIASFMTPLVEDRATLTTCLGQKVKLVWMDTPFSVCKQRDTKNIYATQLPNICGQDLGFQSEGWDMALQYTDSIEQSVKHIIDSLGLSTHNKIQVTKHD